MLSRSTIRRRRGEQGYIMLLLLLTVALMIIAAAVVVPSITFEIKRDREDEMIHRGVQYSRAIRAYYKKFGRYPAKIEDLENTNQLRFLRKRYKDPLTGKDFKLLHFGEAKMSMNGMGGGMIPGAATIGGNGSLNTANGMVQASGFGNAGAFGANSNSAFGQSPQVTNPQSGATQTTGGNASQPESDPSQTPAAATGPNPAAPGNNSTNSGDKLSGTQFGGAPIVGVASISKEKTIREFDKKKKYNEWQFVYDPAFDRGFLITTPYQPQLQMGMQNTPNLNGPNNSGQNNSSGFGTGFGSGFGNSPAGMQNNPTSPAGGLAPVQPINPPPQQQQ